MAKKRLRNLEGCLFAALYLLAFGARAQIVTITEFSAGIGANAQHLGIARGPDGNLWFTEIEGNRIGRIAPLGVVTEFSAGMSPGALPIAITAGPEGNLWLTGRYDDRTLRVTTTGVVTEYYGLTSPAQHAGIALGPDGNLWITENAGNRIARFDTGVVPPAQLAFAQVLETLRPGLC